MRRRKAVYLDGGYRRPSKAALRSLEGHPNRAAILDIINRSPDEYDPVLDNAVPLDSQAGYWQGDTVEDDYSEESYP